MKEKDIFMLLVIAVVISVTLGAGIYLIFENIIGASFITISITFFVFGLFGILKRIAIGIENKK